MTRLRIVAWLAAALLAQACASQQPQQEEPAVPVEAQPAQVQVQVEEPAPVEIATETIPVAKPPPAPPLPREPAGTGLLDAAKLPPFEGDRETVSEPLRGLTTVDRTVPPDDLWQRIRAGFAMPDLDGKLVHDKVAYYAARPDYLQRIFDRSRLYLYHIVEELEKRGLPTELALLPMVESAFNPMAYSRAHASGLWQFIPGTGKRYELAQNWWYDGRRDIVDSTSAALEYLTKLYEMHGDWHLALASYNWGEGAVGRAIARNRAAGKPTDYASLTMPAETRHYIPKLQALKNIIANPEPFGIELDPIPNQPYFVAITKLRDIDVQLAAKLAEMRVEEFVALNPGFSRPLIRAALTPRIVLPADKVDVFHENLTKLDAKSLVSWKSYHPRKGDTLESIAKKHGITLGQLKEVNGISPRNRAVPTLLVVPVAGSAATSMRKMPIMYAPPIPVALRRIFHTIRSGETAAAIARRYGVHTEDLARWNPGVRLTPGKRIMVEVRAPAKAKRKAKRKVAPRRRG